MSIKNRIARNVAMTLAAGMVALTFAQPVFADRWDNSPGRPGHGPGYGDGRTDARLDRLETLVSNLESRVYSLEQAIRYGNPGNPGNPGYGRASCTVTTARGTYTGDGYSQGDATADARNQCLRYESSYSCNSGSVTCRY